MEERVIVTIKDVARKAGVSSMTVSRAFKAESSIKKETRERILEIAKSLNYIPDFNAKSLVTKCKFSIGIFFSSMTTGMSQIYLGELINKIYELLPENYLLSVNSINRVMQMKENIAGRFDGIIIISQSKEDDNFIKEIKEFKLPLVVMNREIKDSKVVNEAAKFITYISSNKESTQIRLEGAWELPPVQDTDIISQYKKKTPPANREAVFKSLNYLVTPPVITQYAELQDIVNKHLNMAASGEVTPEKALEDMQTECEQKIDLSK